MSRRDTLFGLPRYVLAILRHMEAHSERLKWSLAEESNQLTLTLTWNFDSAKPRKTKVGAWLQLSLFLSALDGDILLIHDILVDCGCTQESKVQSDILSVKYLEKKSNFLLFFGRIKSSQGAG